MLVGPCHEVGLVVRQELQPAQLSSSSSLSPNTASACSGYAKCHCTNADGTANDTATEQPLTTLYILEEDSVENLQNCRVRKHCAKVGATGNDSFCEVQRPWYYGIASV
ncbi:hypothetical protein LX32DRAFT_652904 [Colletotrichum zoysiae]|uniref:Uncharacterized protein n=1 Tax=Colletotrichum zoysiae TaxID=1216348 RepID=A0AAD9HGI5_9PEZI|nr:hypothetical protein LX32DRAFT_652904 [Colletotrichum zoysiae]